MAEANAEPSEISEAAKPVDESESANMREFPQAASAISHACRASSKKLSPLPVSPRGASRRAYHFGPRSRQWAARHRLGTKADPEHDHIRVDGKLLHAPGASPITLSISRRATSPLSAIPKNVHRDDLVRGIKGRLSRWTPRLASEGLLL